MAGTAAIVAHFDPLDEIAPNVLEMLRCLESAFGRVLLVSTSQVDPEALSPFRKVELIVRPNIGYDFYSYRVGLNRLGRHSGKVLLINTSIAVLDDAAFVGALQSMLTTEADAVGIALSRQFEAHLQSYMLLLGAEIIKSPWFRSFIDSIEPLGDKMEIVRRHEIGLSSALRAHDVPLTALYAPTPDEARLAETQWRNCQRTNGETPAPSTADQYNPLQFHAEAIARRFGFIKSEVLRDNPHNLDLSFVQDVATPERFAAIDRAMQQDQRFYVPARPGQLAKVSAVRPPIPAARVATWGTPHTRGVRLAAVAHIFFPDLLEELLSKLEAIVEPFDLYLTTPHEQLVAPLLRRGATIASSVTIALTDNRGRDIGPFMRLYRDGLLDGYLAVLKLHTKKSRYSDKGDSWRDSLLDELAGDSLKVRRVIALFEKGRVGMVGPQADYLSASSFWGSNRDRVEQLFTVMGAGTEGRQLPLGFFAGSMFWFAPQAFEPLKTIPEPSLAFEPEAGQQDGTLAHALERAFAPLARGQGFVTTSLRLGGQEIAETDTSQNRVPVL